MAAPLVPIDLDKMRDACQLTRHVLNELCTVVEDIEEDEAMCTDDLDHIAATLIFGNDAYPSPLLYKG